MSGPATPQPVPVCHFVKGEAVFGTDATFRSGPLSFATPRLDLDSLVWPRPDPGPAFDVPVAEIMDVLLATGQWLTADPEGLVAQALEWALRSNPMPKPILERAYAGLGAMFNRANMEFQIAQELGGTDVLDGWRSVATPRGRDTKIRAFPARLVHVIAGNAPGVAAQSVLRGALTKGVNLLKLPSNDLFSATTVLRAMAAVAPGHPVTRSFSAVYWRGGDPAVEGTLFRPQYFDKLVAWGGESTIRSARAYIGPGFELVAFDPKTSISLIGREAFASESSLAEAADAGAADATLLDQQACAASRFQFVEGGADEIDRYCAVLQQRMGIERMAASGFGTPLPANLRDEVEGLRGMEPYYRIWGGYEGRGVVIRSEEPVEFHPDHKIVNVVPVADLADALRHVTVATQSVGVYPASRKAGLRDRLAAAGAQRIVTLGGTMGVEPGLPHDGFRPLQRLVRWVSDEN